jgi:hypothetical protein
VRRVYAAGARAVSVISDGKTELVLEDSGAQCVAVDPKDPETVFVGTFDEGIFKSEDGGKSWERLSGGRIPGSLPSRSRRWMEGSTPARSRATCS